MHGNTIWRNIREEENYEKIKERIKVAPVQHKIDGCDIARKGEKEHVRHELYRGENHT